MRNKLLIAAAFTIFGITLTVSAQYQGARSLWVEPGSNQVLPDRDAFDDVDGSIGVVNASGKIDTEGHPFFTARERTGEPA